MQLTEEAVRTLGEKDPSWLFHKRQEAWESFNAMKETPIRYGLTINYSIPKLSSLYAVPSQERLEVEAPLGIEILKLHDAIKSHPFLFEKYFLSIAPTSTKESRVISHHIAGLKEGLFIRVPQNYSGGTIHIKSNMQSPVCAEYIFLLVCSGAQIRVHHTAKSNVQGDGLRSELFEVLIEDGASCTVFKVQELQDVVNFERKGALLGRKAKEEKPRGQVSGCLE